MSHDDETDAARGASARGASGEPRYERGSLLGRGGMAEVHLCKDLRLGREVAVKTRIGGATTSPRFLREVYLQARLEHPAIVPVYDIEYGPDGEVSFAMKRVRGSTLREIITGVNAGDPAMVARFTLRKLLGVYVSVLQAVAFAHARGVLHRDLKPANVMVGDFGEVYVLDWGVAKTSDASDTTIPSASPSLGDDATTEGSLVGTPGYMSPEQARAVMSIDERADVYSLGCILFEILTGERLHVGAGVAKIVSTLDGKTERRDALLREAGTPPELAAICARATAHEPEDRHRSVAELIADVERFIEGNQVVELRRRMAEAHAKQAASAHLRLLRGDETEEPTERSRALREAGRALAFDPQNTEAAATLVHMLETPPRVAPAEVEEALADEERARVRIMAKLGSIGFASLFLFIPMLTWMGVRSWPAVAAIYVPFALFIAVCGYVMRTARPRASILVLLVALGMAGIGASSSVCGPMIVVPGFVAVNAMAVGLVSIRFRAALAALAIAAVFVPVVLELLGVVPASYMFSDGVMIVQPRMVAFSSLSAWTFLATSALSTIAIPAVLVGRLRSELSAAERRNALFTWQLRQLLPDRAGDKAG